MIDMYSKYDDMNENVIFYALICIDNHIITCINCMLSKIDYWRSLERESSMN